MIVYNVTVSVELDSAIDWLNWLKLEHAPEVLTTGCFVDYSVYEVLDHEQEGYKTYAVKYTAKDMEDYEKYVREHAETMKGKAFEIFGNKFFAFRTLLRQV